MAEDKKLDSLLERIYQDGVEKSNKKADEIISNAKSEADRIIKEAESKSEEIIKEAQRKADKLKRFTVKPYDIIISCSGTIGKISIIMPEDRIGIINQALLILRLDLSKVNVKYIKHYLECFPNLIVTSSGGAITNIEKREIIEKIKIPVPPLEEQERIVNILDKFDALCNDITRGLPAEIELRKKQYEYYRDKLLTFKEKKV